MHTCDIGMSFHRTCTCKNLQLSLFFLKLGLSACCHSPFIAVVGGGIGGTAAAYYLRQEFGPGVKIDVFEPGNIGGRLATVKVGDYDYETGGAVIHPLNLHMKHFIEKLGKDQYYSNKEIHK